MKTIVMRKMKVGFLSLFTLLALSMTACQKNNGGNAAPPPPPPAALYPGCVDPNYCGGNGQGTISYGGSFIQNALNFQGGFQVIGDASGTGAATMNGTLVLTQPYLVCAQPIAPGSYPIVSNQPGSLLATDAFRGYVMVGPYQALVEVIPVQFSGKGLFSISFVSNGCATYDMNF